MVQTNSSVMIKDALMSFNVVIGNLIVMTAVMKMDVVCVLLYPKHLCRGVYSFHLSAHVLVHSFIRTPLLQMSGCFFMAVVALCLFLVVLWIGLQCVIVVFPYDTHLLFEQQVIFRTAYLCVTLDLEVHD